MSIKADCAACKEEIEGKAALILLVSPPDDNDFCNTQKIHICRKCKLSVSLDILTMLRDYHKKDTPKERKKKKPTSKKR